VVKPQGRRGEVAAEVLTDFPERFAQRRRVYGLAPDGSRRPLELEESWPHQGRIVLKFAGVDSIDQAETLRGWEIQIERRDRVALEPGAAYVDELVGCAVVVSGPAAGGGEREIGPVAEVQFGAGEAPLLIVRQLGREYMIPLAEAYLAKLDLEGRRILMRLPEGMLELDAPLSEEEKREQRKRSS
jgi:16S rRNA processing protein RimM